MGVASLVAVALSLWGSIVSNELMIIMLWCWLQGYNSGLESAEEKIKKAFAETKEENDDEDESTSVCSKVPTDQG